MASVADDTPMLSRSRIVLITVVIVVALDQITKSWAVGLNDGRTVDVVGSLRFRLAFNTGMAFSKGQGQGVIITLVALVIVGVMIWMARSARSPITRVAIGLVIGGAIGNIVDRLLRDGLPGQARGFLGGAVVDFIDLQWWPTFNVADAAICVGGVLVAVMLGREERLAAQAEAGVVAAGSAETSGGESGGESVDNPIDNPIDAAVDG